MSPERASREQRVVLVLVIALGILLRGWGLASWQWEQDELYTLRDAVSLDLFSDSSPGIAGRPLYYLIQHVLLIVGPATELFMRLPAFVFGILGIVAAWWLGRRTFGETAGLVAALLVAVSPWHLHASQFARYWSLVFLLAALTYCAIQLAIDTDTRRRYLLALIPLGLGALTHPTFLFPLMGVVLGLHLVHADGRVQLRWPTARAWAYLWGPFLLVLVGHFVVIRMGSANALRNMDGRGLAASVRLIPAMVQWAPLVVAVAAVAATAFLVFQPRLTDRRFGLMTLLGTAGGLILLLAASFYTGVYADYGIGLLPLAYVAVGGGIQRVGDALPRHLGPWAVGGAAATLALAAAPGTLSHLSDGSRFDYRSAYAAILQIGPDQPVAGGIDAFREVYAPETERLNLRALEPWERPTGFWFVTSYQRYGVREGGRALQRWLDRTCRRIAAWERLRLDYRVYRVELLWCGTDPIPSSEDQ